MSHELPVYVERVEIRLVRSDGVVETLEALPADGQKLAPKVSVDFQEDRTNEVFLFAGGDRVGSRRERHVRIQLDDFRGTLVARRDPPLAA